MCRFPPAVKVASPPAKCDEGERVKTSLLVLAAEEKEHVIHLPMPAEVYPLIALGAFMLLLIITLSWKGISFRH